MLEMTKQELLEYAEAHGISGVSSKMTKGEILGIIINHENSYNAQPLGGV